MRSTPGAFIVGPPRIVPPAGVQRRRLMASSSVMTADFRTDARLPTAMVRERVP
jgi:hypothetical protein